MTNGRNGQCCIGLGEVHEGVVEPVARARKAREPLDVGVRTVPMALKEAAGRIPLPADVTPVRARVRDLLANVTSEVAAETGGRREAGATARAHLLVAVISAMIDEGLRVHEAARALGTVDNDRTLKLLSVCRAQSC